MMAKNKKFLILLSVVALVVLNIWRWWPTAAASSDREGRTAEGFSIEDFEVKVTPADTLPPLSRDLFHPKKVLMEKPQIIAVLAPVLLLPPKSPEEFARESAQAEFSKIRCVGVSIRNDHIQAYLVINATESLLVSNGDKVGSHFVVEKIMSDGVSLRDPDTGVGGQIFISGK